jgi:predicted nucleotidyltransferase
MAPCFFRLPSRSANTSGGIEVSRLRASLDAALRDAGISWAELEERASEVVLFGSRASGVATAESDWDLLLVGRGRRLHTDAMDLIWVTPDRLCNPQWLGSELANHVVAYGFMVAGGGGNTCSPDRVRSTANEQRSSFN